MDESPPTENPPDTPSGALLSPPAYITSELLKKDLADAELLQSYAAVSGTKIDDSVRAGVQEARMAMDAGKVTQQVAANLLSSLTTLAASVKPVTAVSLCTDAKEAKDTIRFIGIISAVVGILIVLISLATYFSSTVADRIKSDIDLANGLASKLRTELGPSPTVTSEKEAPTPPSLAQADKVWYGTDKTPPGLSDHDVIGDLQLFAATMRQINGYSKQLRFVVLDSEESRTSSAKPPDKPSLELHAGLDRRLAEELTDLVSQYQDVRANGNRVEEKVTVYYGAIATCILPMLYAILGACAYLLRAYEDQLKNRTLVGNNRHIARLLIAGIGGLVVGLFNNLTPQGITYPPFAEAFLVGYAADVFFTFLESLLQIFKKGAVAVNAPGANSGSSG
jgi:hypothetical protein